MAAIFLPSTPELQELTQNRLQVAFPLLDNQNYNLKLSVPSLVCPACLLRIRTLMCSVVLGLSPQMAEQPDFQIVRHLAASKDFTSFVLSPD